MDDYVWCLICREEFGGQYGRRVLLLAVLHDVEVGVGLLEELEVPVSGGGGLDEPYAVPQGEGLAVFGDYLLGEYVE